MQIYIAVNMKIAVKVPIQKASVYQSVTRQNAVILTPILFAVWDKNKVALKASTFEMEDLKKYLNDIV